MWHLLAAETPATADPITWITYLGTIAPLSGFAAFVWWMERRRADRLAEQLEASHQRELEASKEALPMLTRAVDALTLVSSRSAK